MGDMKLYNTLTRVVEQVKPIKANHLGIYTCGPTVYDYAHLGHLRKFTMDDVLIRALRQEGYDVKFVQNITDVGHLSSDGDTGEDKLEKGAKKYGGTAWDVARKFEEHFFYSMDLMGNVRPDVSCRATEHIQSQLELVKTLERKGFTYIIPGDGVYFDTSKLSDYGKLARLDSSQLKAGARVEMVEGKRNPTDFALWKFETPGENRAMIWPSPWAERSFPGWHVECSAMSMEHLGEQFELHTGGIDHIPVHHANEIAQSEAATGKVPFVKIWVHHNFLRVENEKMSKSLGNFFTIDDILTRNYNPKALRLLFLSTHYRSELNFTWTSLAGSQTAWERLVQQVAAIHTAVGERSNQTPPADTAIEGLPEYKEFFAAIHDDLDTATAMTVLWQVVKTAALSPVEQYRLLLEFDQVLGLGLAQITAESVKSQPKVTLTTQQQAEVTLLLKNRRQARADKNWAEADRLRTALSALGVTVMDQPDGSQTVL
jgi:cysteinyl-tRNA synthetase